MTRFLAVAAMLSCGLALVGCHAGGASVPSDPAPRTIAVGTFNIRYANASDGPNAWIHREPLVIDILRDGDFWGLQEALPEQVAAIAKRFPPDEGYAMLVRSRERDPKEGEACPILYRSDRWAIDAEEQGTFWLSETPEVAGSKSWDSSLPRIATYARFTDRSGGQSIYLVNVHLDHRGPTARREAALLVARRMAGRRYPADPVIVVGDFNTGPSSAPVRALLEDPALRLVDAWRAAHPGAPERPTFNGWADACDGDRIDFILVSGALHVEGCEIDDRKRDGRWPSDHAAVRATIRLDR